MVLMTTRSDGGVQASPVTGGVDGEGRIVISTYPERAKSANVAAHGRASVVVLSDEFNGAWVQVDGAAELISLPEAVEPLVDYFRAISGEHPDWDEYRRVMVGEQRLLLRAGVRGGHPPDQCVDQLAVALEKSLGGYR